MGAPRGIAPAVETVPWLLGATGVALCAATAGYVYVFFPGLLGPLWSSITVGVMLLLVEVVVMLIFSLSLVYAGYRLATGNYSAEQQWWVALWTIMGLSGALALVVLVQSNQVVDGRPLSRQTIAEELLLASGGGALVGLFTGLTNAQLRVQDDRMALQRDTFAFVNQFLRHYILNGMQMMQGYAGMIHTDDEEHQEYLNRISDRAEHITEVVSNLRRLAVSMSGGVNLQAINVSKILEDEIRDLRVEYPDATLDTRLEPHVYVLADCFLRTTCRLLIVNAIENADSSDPYVEVTMEVTPDSVYFNVADNGPEVPVATPNRDLDSLEPREGTETDDRIELYIADRIVQRYGGRVAVLENHPQGMIVRSRLDRPS